MTAGYVQPSVTVLLPVYNGEAYLHDAVESIISQDFTDFELLIVDDGSTDDSPRIIAGFADARIRVLKNPRRLKLSGALNRGIQEARGELIARMDADDIALPARLRRQVEFMNRHPEIGLCGAGVEKFGQGSSSIMNYPESHDQIRAYALFDCPFAHPTVVFRRQLFLNNRLMFDAGYYPTEDYELWARAMELFPCYNLPEVLLRYRVHAQSMTGADWEEMDTQAARVAGRQLNRLGLTISAEALRFHRNIGRGESFRVEDWTELGHGERWLIKLKRKNDETGCYEENAFNGIVALVWFRLCMHNTGLGFRVLSRFAKSRLLRNRSVNIRYMAILTASLIKNRLRGPANTQRACQ